MRSLVMILLVSCLLDRTAAAQPVTEVRIGSEPWNAPFAAAELATALQLRLPETRVMVGDCAASVPCVRSSSDARVLIVEKGSERVEVPIDAAAPDEAKRRVAILIATIITSPSAPATTTTPEPTRAPHAWSAGAALGPAVAIADDDASTTVGLTLSGRRRVASSPAFVDLGVKLSGAYAAQSNATKASVSDRAVFGGAAFEQPLGARAVLSLAAGLQYTHPLIDRDEGPEEIRAASYASRYATRVAADVHWSPQPSFALTIGASTTWLFAEREYTLADDREFLDLGFATIDVAVGAQVRW